MNEGVLLWQVSWVSRREDLGIPWNSTKVVRNKFAKMKMDVLNGHISESQGCGVMAQQIKPLASLKKTEIL